MMNNPNFFGWIILNVFIFFIIWLRFDHIVIDRIGQVTYDLLTFLCGLVTKKKRRLENAN
jgi:hypothetical protein